MIKTKLQAAADAASLATVSVNSAVVTTAKSNDGSGTVSGGSTYATNFFNANLATTPDNTGYTNLSPSATVTLSGTTITAIVSYTATGPHLFHGHLGYKTISLSGTSTASYTLPNYINFYLMLDVSGSMSFPSTVGRAGAAAGRQSRQPNGTPAIQTVARSLAISPRRALARKAGARALQGGPGGG